MAAAVEDWFTIEWVEYDYYRDTINSQLPPHKSRKARRIWYAYVYVVRRVIFKNNSITLNQYNPRTKIW